jgi:hypothetical protein
MRPVYSKEWTAIEAYKNFKKRVSGYVEHAVTHKLFNQSCIQLH